MSTHMEADLPSTPTSPTPHLLADVVLIDARTCAACGGMGLSWWYARVAKGQAPQPVVRGPRCTRWRLVDVKAFWAAFAERRTDVAAAAHGTPTATASKEVHL